MWVVTALGEDGGEYIYSVDAPPFSRPTDVACCAYAQHGNLYRDNIVDEWLSPMWRAEWRKEDDDVIDAECSEV